MDSFIRDEIQNTSLKRDGVAIMFVEEHKKTENMFLFYSKNSKAVTSILYLIFSSLLHLFWFNMKNLFENHLITLMCIQFSYTILNLLLLCLLHSNCVVVVIARLLSYTLNKLYKDVRKCKE